MNPLTKSLLATSFFAAFAVAGATAQTPDAPKKNCTPPIVKRREGARPPKSSRTHLIAVLNVSIDEQGRVTNSNLQNSSGDDEFDGNALDAIKYWTFKPSLCDGKPSSMQVAITFKFTRH
jgi:TonB family protein